MFLKNDVLSKYIFAPLHKYSSLHCMDDAAELGLLIRAPHGPSDPLGEGGCQPVGDL